MKTKVTHTPGPWFYEDTTLWISDTRNRQLAIVKWQDNQKEYPYTVNEEKAKANARLIAAAPDAHRILKAIAEHFKHNDRVNQSALILGNCEEYLGRAIMNYLIKAEGK